MELQHLFHHGKAQTVALGGVAGVALIELFKDMRLRVGAHPLALIGHRDHQGVFCFAQVHGHGAALRAELGGVVQQVEPDFFQQPLAAGVLCRNKVGIKTQLLLPPLLLGHQHALAQLFIQREGCFVGQDSLTLHPVQGQDIRCQVGQPPALVPDDGQVFLLILGRQLLFQQQGRKKEAAGSTMDITMALNVQDNTAFQLVIDPTVGSALKGRGNGMLNLHINPGNGIFNMYGDYTLIEGSFLFSLQNIISKKFIIESGSMIQWTGEPVDARLDINAVYKLKTSLQPLLNTVTASSDDDQSGSRISDRSVPVDCKIHIGGRLSNPQLDFSVVVPVTDIETQAAVASVLNTQEAQAQQFISLVALGTFSNSGSANIGASSGVATGLEMLTNQLTNWFSTDDYRIILNYRAGSEMTGDEVDFGFSTNLINNRLLVEVEGNYIIDNKQAVSNNVSNFMGEAHVTWLIDKSGNLRLKAFTQTIDRFDENQGLQETGIGISYKEDFNNFKDLKQRIRDRFTNKKRQKKRQARREEQARRAAEEAQRQELLLPEDPPEPEYDLERD